MSASEGVSAADRIAAAQARRDALKAAEAEMFAEKFATDLEALAELEAEHGEARVLRIDIGGWKPGAGAATMIVGRVPTKKDSIYKRFVDTVAKQNADNVKATDTLAAACLVYPAREDADLFAATMELAPGALTTLGLQLVKAVQGHAEEEKKG